MIDPGSEWFAINDPCLPVLRVVDRHPGMVEATVPGLREPQRFRPEDFRRDYRQNVPITPELLEGMGWPMCSAYYRLSPWADCGLRATVDEDAFGVTRVHVESTSGDEHTLPTPPNGWKLRDLLNTLRVLGVQCDVPEVVAH